MISRESLLFIKSVIARIQLSANEPNLVEAAKAIATARDEVNKELESTGPAAHGDSNELPQ